MNFVVILMIILLCFGLSRQAIKYPNEEFRWSLVKQIFLEPYFMLYGEVYADTIDRMHSYFIKIRKPYSHVFSTLIV